MISKQRSVCAPALPGACGEPSGLIATVPPMKIVFPHWLMRAYPKRCSHWLFVEMVFRVVIAVGLLGLSQGRGGRVGVWL